MFHIWQNLLATISVSQQRAKIASAFQLVDCSPVENSPVAPQLHIKLQHFFLLWAIFWALAVGNEVRGRSRNLKRTALLISFLSVWDRTASVHYVRMRAQEAREIAEWSKSLSPRLPHNTVSFPAPLSPILSSSPLPLSPFFLLDSPSSSRHNPPLPCHLSTYLPIQLRRKPAQV